MAKRIIPCLDMKGGRVVKGVNFVGLSDIGDPVERAAFYEKQGADEIAFLDISASNEDRDTMVEVAEKTAGAIHVPFCVGGGIRTVEDFRRVMSKGADKCSINTAAVKTPELIKEASEAFGSGAVIVAVDVVKTGDSKWEVVVKGGTEKTGLDAIEWSKKCEELGAGEILLTSMDKDGTKDGYDLEVTRAVAEAVNIPVIASGGAGTLEDIYLGLTEGKADAALVASMVHYGIHTIKEIKEYLRERGVEVI
ncbi:MAG: imidazole glycerol phosphate synthase subunit HisF, partial [Armatimonadetes bacterium]|nr:imidazole glycerol phosphate synthase subunit HisF [Candidatus Hippobium faecium]